MKEIVPRIYRTFKVSAGTSLFTLADKIVTPIMGWCRNYHSFCFVEQRDGSVYGDSTSKMGHIDDMHIDTQGIYKMIDARTIKLCQVLQKEGDKMGYIYDFGDTWRHMITLDKIVPLEESNGKVELIKGENSCPPENGSGLPNTGNYGYAEALKKGKIKKGKASEALNIAPSQFDPTFFSLEKTRKDLLDALNSSASTGHGKQFFMNLGGMGSNDNQSPFFGNLQNEKVKTSSSPGGFKMTETISTVKDPKNIAICANCGNPNNIKRCSGCRKISYCSPECQKNSLEKSTQR